MKPVCQDKRRATRFLIEAGATVEVSSNGRIARATTENMSGCGILLRFKEPVQLAVGDEVTCDLQVLHADDEPLPYWGLGSVVRIDGCRVAMDLKAGGLSRKYR